MQGASDEFVKHAAKDVGPLHSRVAKMQGKLAKSELRRREQGVAEGEYDSRKPFGVRYKVFAGREGRLTTKEYWTTSSEKLKKAVAKIEALGNFYEIDGYSYPKEKQGVAEGKMGQVAADINDLSDIQFEKIYGVPKKSFLTKKKPTLAATQTKPKRDLDYCPRCQRGDNRCICETVSESATTEDVVSSVKKKLGDYLADLSKQIKSDSDLKDKTSADIDQIKAVKTIHTDDGHEIKIHGNEDDGFRITIRDKEAKTRFSNLDEATMAVEMYCARRVNKNKDYLEEQ
jgi:hypothetical protein